MNADFRKNHFELFGLPPRFVVDAAALDRAYREIQSRVHPDKFVHAADTERRLSMQRATQVNEAYRTLKDPLARARYLLGLHGVDIQSETNTAMPAEFLVQQIEWREAVEEAAGQSDSLDALALRLQNEMKQLYGELERSLDAAGHAQAAATVRKLMFLERLREEIGDAQERLDA
jgi:molecular chaperone HscB